MAVNYSQVVLNGRLQVVLNAIDAFGNGFINLYIPGNTLAAQIQLARPSGTINAGVLTFLGLPLVAPQTLISGNIVSANITDANGTVVASGLTVSNSTTTDIVMTTTTISSNQTIALTFATITGS